jgi:hypothetical protein
MLTTANHTSQVAVTYQRCVIKGVHPRALLSTNGQINSIEVGNVKYLRFVLQPSINFYFLECLLLELTRRLCSMYVCR